MPTNFKKRDEAFENWQPALKQLLRTPAKWGGWPLYHVSKMTAAANGPLCLVGDAAHAMLPFAAQGGACAIEDAAILAEQCSKNPDDLITAFKGFEKIRKRRVNRVLEISRNNRRLYHMKPPLSALRDIGMQLASQNTLQKRMEWLYSWRAERP